MKRGFTLIEMLIVIGLMAAIIPILLSILTGELKCGDKVIQLSLGRQAETILSWRLTSAIRGAETIKIVSSTEVEVQADGLTDSYIYDSGIIKRKSGKSVQPLSNPGEIEGLSFRSIRIDLIEVAINKRKVLICKE